MIELCIGTWFGGRPIGRWQFDQILDAAAERGIRKIDTSPRYLGGNAERWTGRWLRKRADYAFSVATRVHLADFSSDLSNNACAAELRRRRERLGLPKLDNALLEEVPASMTAQRLGRVVAALMETGETRNIGLHYPAPETLIFLTFEFGARARTRLRAYVPFAARGCGLDPYLRTCSALAVPVTVYGAVRGNGATKPPIERIRFAMQWLSHFPSVDTLIIGATKPEHLMDLPCD